MNSLFKKDSPLDSPKLKSLEKKILNLDLDKEFCNKTKDRLVTSSVFDDFGIYENLINTKTGEFKDKTVRKNQTAKSLFCRIIKLNEEIENQENSKEYLKLEENKMKIVTQMQNTKIEDTKTHLELEKKLEKIVTDKLIKDILKIKKHKNSVIAYFEKHNLFKYVSEKETISSSTLKHTEIKPSYIGNIGNMFSRKNGGGKTKKGRKTRRSRKTKTRRSKK
jgi:hypothetical protein